MAFRYVDAILQALHNNAALHDLVDGNLFKFKSLEESEAGLGRSTHKSLISVELRSWPGSKEVTEPVPVIDIRSRSGAEYCLEIAKAVKDIIDDGISEVIDGIAYVISISSLDGDLTWDKTLLAWRLIYVVKGIIYNPATVMSLTPSLASPQKPDNKVIWFCACPEATTQEIRYRFSLNGPRTGSIWQDVTGWTPQAYWLWVVSASDIGANQVKVEVRNAQGLPSADASSTASYMILANALPVLSALTPSLASPQAPKVSVSFTAEASDAEGDWILYRFWLNGPGTGNVWQDQTGWQTENRWVWNPRAEDVGTSQVKVEIIDQMHAGRSGYDASLTVNYTINDTTPTISGVVSTPGSPTAPGTPVTFICSAAGGDTDSILYRFVLNGGGTGCIDRELAGWQSGNSHTWTPQVADIGSNSITVYVRDGKHAGPGGYDDSYTAYHNINANSAPIIQGISFSPTSPQFVGKTVEVIVTASDPDLTDDILYKFQDLHLSALARVLEAPSTHVMSLALHSSGLGFAISYDEMHLYRTRDRGINWEDLGDLGLDDLRSVAIFDNGVVIVSGSHQVDWVPHIVRSTDEGDHFTVVYSYPNGDAEAVCGLTVHSSGVALAYSMCDGKILRSPDFGENWSIVYSSGYEAVYGGFCFFDNGVVLGGYDGLLRSINWGETWAEVSTPGLYGSIMGLACDPATGYALLGGVDGLIYMTDDWGLTISLLVNLPSGIYGQTPCLHIEADGLTFYACDNKVYVSPSWGSDPQLYYSFPDELDCVFAMAFLPGIILIGNDIYGQGFIHRGTYDRTDLTAWQARNTFSWSLSRFYEGLNIIKAMVRDGAHAGPGSCDDSTLYSYEVSGYAVPTIASLTPYPASPRVPEQSITFTATATDPNDDGLGLMYRFWLQGPGTSNQWRMQTGWQSLNHWTWRPTLADAGSNNIKVEVRNGKLAGPGSYDATTTVVYTINA